MERNDSPQDGAELSEEWVLVEILGDHAGWEAEAERAETEVREAARQVGAGFFVFQNCPPAPDGTPRVRIIAYSRRLRDTYLERTQDRSTGA